MCKYRVMQEKGDNTFWKIQRKILGIWFPVEWLYADSFEEAEDRLKDTYFNRKVSKEYVCK